MKKVSLIITILMAISCTIVTKSEQTATLHQVSEHITVGFTCPSYNQTTNPITDKIVSLINSQSTDAYLDVCIYGFDEESIISALEEAIEKGVHVRMLLNADNYKTLADKTGSYYDGYCRIATALDKKFPLTSRRTTANARNRFDDFRLFKSKSGIMHNKFMIFTSESGEQTLAVGSANFTYSCLNLNYNDILFVEDAQLCNKYRRQFEYLLGLRQSPEGRSSIVVDQTKITAAFSQPTAKSTYIIDELIKTVECADTSIKFMTYSFTHSDLCSAMIARCENGISVEGIYDKSQLKYSKDEMLVEQNIECSVDGNEFIVNNHGGKLHNKCMIVDDETVVTGSFNWSANADRQNQENILFIKNPTIAKIYSEYWEYVKKSAKTL